ncbi:MAG: hypothetical protein GXY80_02725 [Syntrophorhabdus aromaticivorans]|uniref:Uncharacterized protein n=1 Tax=Syntrophorhabdus aromaticivorans TaxID=328301 RepID=A0A971S097_9BACT|nr:hypothetical protein [Syntrophorhabdus aromaticivorans]
MSVCVRHCDRSGNGIPILAASQGTGKTGGKGGKSGRAGRAGKEAKAEAKEAFNTDEGG